MKKYIETAKVQFKAQLAYRFDIITSMVFTVSKILLAYVLWGAVFGTRDMVAGFTLDTMLSYYIISSFLTQLDQSNGIGWQIADEIRNGRFSKYIVKPINVFGYFASQTTGVSLFLFSFNLVAAVIWFLLFRVQFAITTEPFLLLSAVALTLLGLLFMTQLNYYIGILAFRFLDTSNFMMIKDNVMEFVRGSLIPLAILPAGVIKGMMLFPFYYVSYLPSMLLIGRNRNEALPGILVLICWNMLFGLLNQLTYKKLRSRYDGVGI